jgi:hypothetical protein
MILRRISEHVRNQNWFAVGVDFVIVVMGVFIGIQVSNWNTAREDRSNETLYLGYLAEDLQSDLRKIDNVCSVTEWRMSALAAVITAATGEPMPSVRAMPQGDVPIESAAGYQPTASQSVIMAMSLLVTFDSSNLAYSTLVSTGGIRLVRNQELTRGMQEYDAAVRDLQRIESRLTIYRDEHTRALQQAGVAWIDPMTVAAAAEVARNHPELLAAMKNFWSFNGYHLRTLRAVRALAAELMATAEREAAP